MADEAVLEIGSELEPSGEVLDGGEQLDGTQDGVAQDSEGQQQAQADGQQQQQGVVTGKSVRDAVRSLSEAHPEHARLLKTLADTHFTVATAYRQAFPTPREAASAKALIDGLGGVDGASALQARIQGYDAQETGLESGDPAVLDSFFKDYPDGAAALAPHYLERLSQTNPQAFSNTIAPYAIGMLQQAGIDQHVASLLNETDPARLKAGVQQLSDWLTRQGQGVAQIKAQSGKAPGADKLAGEREKLNTEREELFREGVRGTVNTAVTPVVQTEVEKYAKQYKLSDDQKNHFKETLQAKVIADMNADPTYKKQVDLRYANKGRTHQSVADFIAAEFNRRVREKSFDVVKGIYGAPKGGQQQNQGNGVIKAGTPRTAPGGGPIKVAVKPPDSELDMSRPDSRDLLFKLQAYTKGGRLVTWAR